MIDLLPPAACRAVVNLLRELYTILDEWTDHGTRYSPARASTWDSTTSATHPALDPAIDSTARMASLLSESPVSSEPHSSSRRWHRRLSWSLGRKHSIEGLVTEFELWGDRLQALLESVWWGLPGVRESLEKGAGDESGGIRDADVEGAGLLRGVEVRKLVLATPGEGGTGKRAVDRPSGVAIMNAAGLAASAAVVARLQIPSSAFSPLSAALGGDVSGEATGASAGAQRAATTPALSSFVFGRLSSSAAVLAGGDQNDIYLVEYRSYAFAPDPKAAELLRARAFHLAILSHTATRTDTQLRILSCIHYFDDRIHERVGIVYRIPEAAGEPQVPDVTPKQAQPIPLGDSTHQVPVIASLATLLTSSTARRPTLHARFHLAACLARAVHQLHSYGWLHKSLCPASILFFISPTSTQPPSGSPSRYDLTLPEPYLGNLSKSRPAALSEHSSLSVHVEGVSVLHTHPSRWQTATTVDARASARFTAEHDIYGLGVMLLEIGLWEAVGQMDRGGIARLEDGVEVRRKLVGHAVKRLGFHCGAGYRAVVIACLTGRVRIQTRMVEGEEGVEGSHVEHETDVVDGFEEGVLGVLAGLARSET